MVVLSTPHSINSLSFQFEFPANQFASDKPLSLSSIHRKARHFRAEYQPPRNLTISPSGVMTNVNGRASISLYLPDGRGRQVPRNLSIWFTSCLAERGHGLFVRVPFAYAITEYVSIFGETFKCCVKLRRGGY